MEKLNFYVYIIQSDLDGSFYKGYTCNPMARLIQHNLGNSKYTSLKKPWKFVYIQICNNKSDAIKRELSLKKAGIVRINSLIASPINIVKQFSV